MISELNDATSDSDGNVELADGRFLHAIELIPAPAHYDFSLTEHKIVKSALAYIELGHQCYRALDKELLPGLKVLDYAEVAKVRIKKLKPVVRHVINLLPDVSDTQIIATLKRAGMQLPRSRPRGQAWKRRNIIRPHWNFENIAFILRGSVCMRAPKFSESYRTMSRSSPECASAADVWPVLTALNSAARGRSNGAKLKLLPQRLGRCLGFRPALRNANSTIHPAQGGGDEN